ncbi:MAG TPA: GNAT family N-acetyltransferase [Polyangia bacterium]|jgi:GNAT superfamily N-acetyltransferase|nr:GNAT family N-acetyltransferase [Polyangia bacterium]
MHALDVRLPPSWDTAAAALGACAQALGDPRDGRTLAAASGLAFRIALDRRLSPAGPHGYPWREELTAAAERLGYDWRLVASRAGEPGFERACDAAFELGCLGVEAGRPTLWFGVQVAEFGLVRGADRAAGRLSVSGLLDAAGGAVELDRAQIGAEAGLVFALQLIERVPQDPAAAALATLRTALEHARGGRYAGALELPVIFSGAEAWQLWEEALTQGDVDPLGLAFAAQRYAEARAHVAQYLPMAAQATGLDLGQVAQGYRRAATMLTELARLVPYPPGPSFMLTTTLRDEAAALVSEAARAEREAIWALGPILAAAERARATAGLELRPLNAATLPDLFACVAEIPISGLREEAAQCRARLEPLLGQGSGSPSPRIDGRLLYQMPAQGRGRRLVGHILWAPLEQAGYGLRAEGVRWFLYCPWIERARRGQGAGRRLFEALVEAARAAGVDGILTLATSIDVFLHHEGYERGGFVEVARQGDTRLLELCLTETPSRAQFVEPPPAPPGGPLPVVVRHNYHCPLLLRVRREVVQLGRQLGSAVRVDEADVAPGEVAGVTVGGQRLPHGPMGREPLRRGLEEAISHWRR